MGCGCFQKNDKKKGNINRKQTQNKNKSSVIDDDLEDNNWSKTKLEKYLTNLYKSYYAAKTYFCSNDLKEKEVDAIKNCKKIISAQDLLKQGKHKSININELPKEITPEYITGYNEEERKEKINYILNRLKQEKEDAKKSLNEKLEEIKQKTKKVKKEDIETFKIESKQLLDNEKNKISVLSKEIESINGILNNKYIPVPEYVIKNEDYKIEKINKDIPENTIRISVSDLTYTKSNPLIRVNLKSDNNVINSKEIKGKNKNDINETFDWVLNEKDFNYLMRKRIEIILERTYMIKKNKIKGTSDVSLRNLSKCDIIGGVTRLNMASGKDDQYIDVTIKIRSPLVEKEYDTASREVLKIKKIYPEFNIDGDNDNISINNKIDISVNKILKEIESESVHKKQKETNEYKDTNIKIDENINIKENNENNKINVKNDLEKKVNKNINLNYNNNNNKNEKIDKKVFKEEELNDVDCIDNLNSLKVLKDRLKKVENEISKIDGRTPKELLQKKIKIKVKINNLESQMGDGEISPKDYLLLMEHQLKHDILLCKYLKQENQIEKAKCVFTRINLLNEEINELKQYIK